MRHSGQFKAGYDPNRHQRKLSEKVEKGSLGEAISAGMTIAQIARDQLTVPAIEKLYAILINPNTKDSDAIAAARLAIERGWGSVTNKVELSMVPNDLTKLTDDELHAIASQGEVYDHDERAH